MALEHGSGEEGVARAAAAPTGSPIAGQPAGDGVQRASTPPGERKRTPPPIPPDERSEPTGKSDPPAGPAEPTTEDYEFVAMLREAGLCAELEREELRRISAGLPPDDADARRLSLLERYYGAGADEAARKRRVEKDRFFLHRDRERTTAARLVQTLAALTPELEPRLERIGHDAEGPLVLRAGEHLAAVFDEYEEQLDTDEIDLRILEEPTESITVSGIVRALNVLLARHQVPRRLVELCSDGEREAYIAVDPVHARALCSAGYLELEDPDDVREFGAWG